METIASSLVVRSALALRDGRRLTFSAAGSPGGFPVLHFHGAVGSPLWHSRELRGLIHDLDLHYVMVDRPGFGGSTPGPGRTVAGFAQDVEQLVDHLGIRRFGVVGVSAGAPYALGVAAALHSRVVGVTAVSCQAPGPLHSGRGTALRYRVPLWLLDHAPLTSVRIANGGLAMVRRHPRLLAGALRRGACPADRNRLAEEAGGVAERTLRSFGAGASPMIDDYRTCCADWGFAPRDVHVPVQLWHGELDPVVPLAQAVHLHEQIPLSHLTVEPAGGHFILTRRLAEVIAPLVPGPVSHEFALAAA